MYGLYGLTYFWRDPRTKISLRYKCWRYGFIIFFDCYTAKFMTLFKGVGNCQKCTTIRALTIAIFTRFVMFTESFFLGRFKF